MANDPNAFLMGGGVPSFKFENVGDEVEGEIISMALKQQTDFKTREPLFWNDGSPRQHLEVTLKTDLRDASDPKDSGERRIYIKGNMQRAVQEAVRTSGASGLDNGGRLKVKYTGNEPAKERGLSPSKLYSAVYTSLGTAYLAASEEEETTPSLSEAQKAALEGLSDADRAAVEAALRAVTGK